MSVKVEIFTDGSAKGNPGRGGYGTILRSSKKIKELCAGYRLTTNNRMELLSVIVGLEALKFPGTDVTVFSDSKYVVDAVNQNWVFGWKKNNFRGKKNADLWDRFLRVYPQHHVKFVWIKGHAGHPENERCDELAVAASDLPKLLVDEGYENSIREDEGLF